MFDEYLYIVRVYEDDETYEYEYGNLKHARQHHEEEFAKGNKANIFRYKDGEFEEVK